MVQAEKEEEEHCTNSVCAVKLPRFPSSNRDKMQLSILFLISGSQERHLDAMMEIERLKAMNKPLNLDCLGTEGTSGRERGGGGGVSGLSQALKMYEVREQDHLSVSSAFLVLQLSLRRRSLLQTP